MKNFSWKGIDAFGKIRRGRTAALSEETLKKVLLEQGIALFKFYSVRSSKLYLSKKRLSFGGTQVDPKELIHFFTSLLILLEGGENLLATLKMVLQRVRSYILRQTVEFLIKDLNHGFSLSRALAKHKEIFSAFVVNAIAVGESSGRLTEACRLVTDYLEAKSELRTKLKQAAFLPTITLIFALLIVLLIFVFVIPRFEILFADFEQPVPAMTQMILNISALFRSPVIFIVFIFLLGLFLGTKLFFRKSKSLKKLQNRVILKIYFLRNFVLLSNQVYFIGALATLLSAGMPLVNAIDQARLTVSNFVIQEKIKLLTGYINSGKSLGQAMELVGNNYFPEDLVAAVFVGERAGNLHGMLNKILVLFKQDLQTRISFVATTLQPILVILIGIIIALIMIAVYLPILNLASMI